MTITHDPPIDLPEPPKVSGDDGATGHLEELRRDPIGLMQRVRDECGDVGEFRLAQHDVVLLTGAEANEVFFRAPDDTLDQAAAYPFMTPIFGEGVVFDASPERRREMLHNMALRDKMMRGHAETIEREVDEMVAAWDRDGELEIDLLDWFAELTIYTSSSCLIGRKFRLELDRRFADLYHELEQGTDAIAYVDAHADIPSFRARDRARADLVSLIETIMQRRDAAGPPEADDRDLLDVLMSIADDAGDPRFDADQVTGMFISMMFAGHHTTSGTAAWTLIELLRHPEELAAVRAELDELFADGEGVSYHALRAMPRLEAVVKEALRLHPPLILLLRVAQEDIEVGGRLIRAGKMVGASPAISNRIPEAFDDPEVFRPGRYLEEPPADADNPWNWIPFGAGRHRCVGAQFAMMQIKAIFSVLLRDWDFQAAQPLEDYRNDHSKMVVQLQQPCPVTVRRRNDDEPTGPEAAGALTDSTETGGESVEPIHGSWRIAVDRDLCQGHAVCEGEAPELFSVSKRGDLTVLHDHPADELRTRAEEAVRHCPTRALTIVER